MESKILVQLLLSVGVGLLISGYVAYVLLKSLYKVGNRWLGWHE